MFVSIRIVQTDIGSGQRLTGSFNLCESSAEGEAAALRMSSLTLWYLLCCVGASSERRCGVRGSVYRCDGLLRICWSSVGFGIARRRGEGRETRRRTRGSYS